ncbi:MAG: hypothetical protein ACKO6C_00355, partial [Alphaproteobacteria bacterium]
MQNLIKQVLEFSKKIKINDLNQDNFQNFIQEFYIENKLVDFENYNTESLYYYSLSAYKILCQKKSTNFNIKIYNPTKANDGFESPYTIIEIVNKDMPFLVDSSVNFLDKQSIKINNIIHPVFKIKRNIDGSFVNFDKSGVDESLIQLHLDKITNESEINLLKENLSKIIDTIALVVGDFESMQELVKKANSQIINAKKISNEQEVNQYQEFLNWVLSGNFILLGSKEFDIKKNNSSHELVEVANSASGVFKSKYADFLPEVVNASPQEVGDSINQPFVIEVIKSRYRSKIHRSTNAERIRVQKISNDGKVVGEFRFIGLFTSNVYYSSVFSIPLLKNKISHVIEKSEYVKGSHNYKDLISILESYPRDELFQISEDDLLKNSTGIVSIAGRSIVKFFARKDKFSRFVSCLIYTPRDRTNSDVREKIKGYLCEVFNGEIADSFLQITESNLIRFHVIVRTNKGIPSFDENHIEQEIVKITKVWSDELVEALKNKFENELRIVLYPKYKNS